MHVARPLILKITTCNGNAGKPGPRRSPIDSAVPPTALGLSARSDDDRRDDFDGRRAGMADILDVALDPLLGDLGTDNLDADGRVGPR
jgi:hypothetical protein